MLIVDAHEDLAWNIASFGRDYTHSARWTRACEAGSQVPAHTGNSLLGLRDWLRGEVALIFATIFVAPIRAQTGPWETQVYTNAAEAHSLASAQLDLYHRLVEVHPRFKLVGTQGDLQAVLDSWEEESPPEERLIGLMPSLEGADPILEPEEVEAWYERGLRAVGLAWEGTRYAGGTHEPGPLTGLGYELLEVMADLNMILDLSHLAEESYFQAVEMYGGIAIASHSNPRRFLPTTRGLSDEMIALLAERGGVVGIVPYNLFLKPGWRRGDRREGVSLTLVADAIDHVCQVTGSHRHVGIGTDFDGGLGLEHVPVEVNSVADLQKLSGLLAGRGYEDNQIADILSGNWLRILREVLPD
jgi:membrane dipeptidase